MSPPARGGVERLLLVLTPAVAMTAVGVGLHLGGRGSVRAAVVRGALPSAAATGLAWQVVVFDENQGARETAPGVPLEVVAHATGVDSTWRGVTNDDGVAEVELPIADARGLSLEIRSGDQVLARGEASEAPATKLPAPPVGWIRFARREGAIALDVALLGARAAPGFPADLWVRATDPTTHAPVPGASVTLDPADSDGLYSETGAHASPASRTDSRGWAHLVVTPIGLAVTAALQARAEGIASMLAKTATHTGTWVGGLFMSPGAPHIDVASRVAPQTAVRLVVTTPTIRSLAYVEIDDPHGRAWAATPRLRPGTDGTSRAEVEAPALAPGLYWIAAAADPAGAATLEAGSSARPFFVAPSNEAALATAAATASDRDVCAPPRDPREAPGAVDACLALAPIAPVTRWTALDGFVLQRTLDHEARQKGLAVGLGALAVAVALEAILLLRAAVGGRVRTVAVAVLVGLLGFALLAAFIVRV
jgi:hypothetical protein